MTITAKDWIALVLSSLFAYVGSGAFLRRQAIRDGTVC